jgi:hypothetical protein
MFPISSVGTWRRDEAITTCFLPASRAQSNVALTGLQGAGRDPVEEAWCVEAQHAFHSTTSGSFVPLHQARFSNDCRTWLFGVVHSSILCMFVSICLGGERHTSMNPRGCFEGKAYSEMVSLSSGVQSTSLHHTYPVVISWPL